jgi:hypothetical protein
MFSSSSRSGRRTCAAISLRRGAPRAVVRTPWLRRLAGLWSLFPFSSSLPRQPSSWHGYQYLDTYLSILRFYDITVAKRYVSDGILIW